MDKKEKIHILEAKIINLEAKINIISPNFFEEIKEDIKKIYEYLEELKNEK